MIQIFNIFVKGELRTKITKREKFSLQNDTKMMKIG